jgi:hypothetical protein
MDDDVFLSSLCFDLPCELGVARIRIYRVTAVTGWFLAVLTLDGLVTAWNKPFVTEEDALEVLLAHIARHGANTFFDQKLPRELNH